MLHFVTGVPGAGKTLFTIYTVDQRQKKEYTEIQKTDPQAKPRPVYYFGIKGVTLDWIEFTDIESWYQIEVGAIIIIDEAQKLFRPMPNGAKRPAHYEEFDTHRHRGHDIYLVTQNPMLVDNQVRSMAGYHYHLNRNFGREKVSLYEWQKLKADINKLSGAELRKDKEAIITQFKYPKEYFELYKSAEVHTHKTALPWRKIVPMMGLLLLLFSAVGGVLYWINGNRDIEANGLASNTPDKLNHTTHTVTPEPRVVSTDVFSNPSMFTPKVEGLPLSAPAYGHLVSVRDVPRIDGCMNISQDFGDTCTCNDQRGNRIRVNYETCISFIDNGYFDFTQASNSQAFRRPSVRATREGGGAQLPPGVTRSSGVSVTPQ